MTAFASRPGVVAFDAAGQVDRVLELVREVSGRWRRLADLELAGRTLVTAMRAHMAEVGATMTYLDYFKRFYTDVAAEFVQADDDGFVTHHCLRTLFCIWQDELDALAAGPLGRALLHHLLMLPQRASVVRAGRQPLAAAWYQDVVAAIDAGRAVLEPVRGNPVLPRSDTVLAGRPDLYFGQFLLWSQGTWARQVVVLWQVVRDAIVVRVLADQLDATQLADAVTPRVADFRLALDGLNAVHGEWRAAHLANVEIHDAIPRVEIYGAMSRWLADLGLQSAGFTIKDCLKSEMYREVAASVAALHGAPVRREIPAFHYWRRTPWTPDCLAVGQPGLPPFS